LRSTVSPGAPDVGVFRYGLAGWLMPSGHQYVPVSVREQA